MERSWHASATLLLATVAALGWLVPGSLWCVSIVGALLLLRSLIRQWQILLLFLALTVLGLTSAAWHVVAVGVMLTLIIMRFDQLWKRRAIAATGACLYILAATQQFVALTITSPLTAGSGGIAALLSLSICAAATFVTTAVMVDARLRQHYTQGYRPSEVVEVAASVPFVVLLLAWSIYNLCASVFSGPASADIASGHGTPDAPNATAAPDAHASPDVIRVSDHARTNPDGIVENNLSFHGPRSPEVPPAPGHHAVQAHLRTLPDGIESNNLSYRGDPAPQMPFRTTVASEVAGEPPVVAVPAAASSRLSEPDPLDGTTSAQTFAASG